MDVLNSFWMVFSLPWLLQYHYFAFCTFWNVSDLFWVWAIFLAHKFPASFPEEFSIRTSRRSLDSSAHFLTHQVSGCQSESETSVEISTFYQGRIFQPHLHSFAFPKSHVCQRRKTMSGRLHCEIVCKWKYRTHFFLTNDVENQWGLYTCGRSTTILRPLSAHDPTKLISWSNQTDLSWLNSSGHSTLWHDLIYYDFMNLRFQYISMSRLFKRVSWNVVHLAIPKAPSWFSKEPTPSVLSHFQLCLQLLLQLIHLLRGAPNKPYKSRRSKCLGHPFAYTNPTVTAWASSFGGEGIDSTSSMLQKEISSQRNSHDFTVQTLSQTSKLAIWPAKRQRKDIKCLQKLVVIMDLINKGPAWEVLWLVGLKLPLCPPEVSALLVMRSSDTTHLHSGTSKQHFTSLKWIIQISKSSLTWDQQRQSLD